MKMVTMYEAEDGKQFLTEDSCLEYEQQCRDTQDANEMLANGATLRAVLTKAEPCNPMATQCPRCRNVLAECDFCETGNK